MIALLLVLCLSSLSVACTSCSAPEIQGRCNGLQLQNALIAVARTLVPACTITFNNATTQENNCDWSFDLAYARVLTDVEIKAHSLALRAVVAADLSVLGILDAALSLSIQGTASPYKCISTIITPPTVANIVANLVTGAVGFLSDIRVTLPLEFLLAIPSAVVTCHQPVAIGAEVHLGLQLTYLRALTQAEINAHVLKIKALVSARLQPDISKVVVVLTKRVGLLLNTYDCGCIIKS